jgi:hypothetical protein
MKKFSLLLTLFALFLLSGCSAEDPIEEPQADLEGPFYNIRLMTHCEASTDHQTRYCVSEDTWKYFDFHKPDYCQTISFKTISGRIVSGVFSGLGKGSQPIDCEN